MWKEIQTGGEMKHKFWTVRVNMAAGNFYVYHKIKSFSKFDAENQAIKLNHEESKNAKIESAYAWTVAQS